MKLKMKVRRRGDVWIAYWFGGASFWNKIVEANDSLKGFWRRDGQWEVEDEWFHFMSISLTLQNVCPFHQVYSRVQEWRSWRQSHLWTRQGAACSETYVTHRRKRRAASIPKCRLDGLPFLKDTCSDSILVCVCQCVCVCIELCCLMFSI